MKPSRVPDERMIERFMSDDLVTRYDTSAMFGPTGPEIYRNFPYVFNGEERHATINRTIGAGWLLYGFVRAIRPRTIVEIGCAGSTFCMLWALRHNSYYPEPQGHLYGIDNFWWGDPMERDGKVATVPYFHFIDELAELGMSDLITFYHESSQVIGPTWDKPIDMLMVDGDHAKEAVLADWEHFSKWIVPGGYAFFHDLIAIPNQIGIPLEDIVGPDFTFMCEPDHLSLGIMQKKFTVDYDAVLETRYRAQLDDRNECPLTLMNARDSGIVKPFEGRWFPSYETWKETVLRRAKEKGHEPYDGWLIGGF